MSDDLIEVVDEHGRLHYFHADVHRAFLAVGLIWREGDRWCCQEKSSDVAQYPELAVCDFCSTRPITWDIEADEFTLLIGETSFDSVGGWVACEACGAAIQAGDRAALDARVSAFVGLERVSGHRVMLAAFWRHFRSIKRYPTQYAAQKQ